MGGCKVRDEVWGVGESQIIQGLVDHGLKTESYPRRSGQKASRACGDRKQKDMVLGCHWGWGLNNQVDGSGIDWGVTVYFSSMWLMLHLSYSTSITADTPGNTWCHISLSSAHSPQCDTCSTWRGHVTCKRVPPLLTWAIESKLRLGVGEPWAVLTFSNEVRKMVERGKNWGRNKKIKAPKKTVPFADSRGWMWGTRGWQ